MPSQKRLNRRDFFKGAATAGVGLAGIGALGASSTTAIASSPSVANLDTDVLVIGMGISGLSAANRAVDQGLRVLLIDKLPKGYWVPGGSMIVAGQSVHVGGKSLMITDAELTSTIMENTANRASNELTTVFVKNAHEAMNWLKSCGVQFEEETGKELTLKPKKAAVTNATQWGLVKPGGVYDATNYGGKINAEILAARAQAAGATLLYETAAERLIRDDQGVITGASVMAKEGRMTVNARAVIICTGGGHFNPEFMTRYAGSHAGEVLPYGTPGATGDGQDMARDIGAGFRYPGMVGGLRPVPEDAVWNPDHLYNNLQEVAYQGLLVDDYGNRLMDESIYNEQKMVLQQMVKHTESVTGMIIVDDAIVKKFPTIKSIIDRITEFNGTIYRADTIDAIAEMAAKDRTLGIRLGRQKDLVDTVRVYNTAIDQGKNLEIRPSRKANLNKIATPPIYGIPFTPMAILSFGGVLSDNRSQVLDKNGKVIPGLYAVGEVTHNAFGGGPVNTLGHETSYVGCLAMGVVFGKLSAENAAAYIKGSEV